MADRIETTDTDLHELRRLVSVARPGTRTVTVDKEALRHLLNDHHTLWTWLQARKLVQITPTTDQGSLV